MMKLYIYNVQYIESNEKAITKGRITKYLEGSGRGIILRYYFVIRLERLRKTMKYLSQDSKSQGRDLNAGSPE